LALANKKGRKTSYNSKLILNQSMIEDKKYFSPVSDDEENPEDETPESDDEGNDDEGEETDEETE
jgi:hypothetical protein